MPDQNDIAIKQAFSAFGIVASHDQEQIDDLISCIDSLLANNFNKLVSILYRMDVNEEKIKQSIQAHPSEPGKVIAALVIQRQIQKLDSRKQYFNEDDIPAEDRW